MVSTQTLQTETIDQSIVVESGVNGYACTYMQVHVYFPISGVAPQMMCIVQAGVQSNFICLHA